MSEAQQIALEFDRAVPGLKGKCRTPHKPEVCLKERGIEVVRYPASTENSFRLKPQALDGQDMSFAQAEFGSVEPVSTPKESGFGRGFHRLIPFEDLLRDRLAFIEGRD